MTQRAGIQRHSRAEAARQGAAFSIRAFRKAWPGFEMDDRVRSAKYQIEVEKTDGAAGAWLGGAQTDALDRGPHCG